MADKLNRRRQTQPQETLDSFWMNFISDRPDFVRRILPHETPAGYVRDKDQVRNLDNPKDANNYAAAREACVQEFVAIVKQCRRRNERLFSDPDFDLVHNPDLIFKFETDRTHGAADRATAASSKDHIKGGTALSLSDLPGSTKRICEVLEAPSFAQGSGKSNFTEMKSELDGVRESSSLKRFLLTFEGPIVLYEALIATLAFSAAGSLGFNFAVRIRRRSSCLEWCTHAS